MRRIKEHMGHTQSPYWYAFAFSDQSAQAWELDSEDEEEEKCLISQA